MECDKDVELWIEKAMLEVEKDLNQPSNMPVNKHPESVTCEPKVKKTLSVVLDGLNGVATVKMHCPTGRDHFAWQEQNLNIESQTALSGATTCHKSNDQHSCVCFVAG